MLIQSPSTSVFLCLLLRYLFVRLFIMCSTLGGTEAALRCSRSGNLYTAELDLL